MTTEPLKKQTNTKADIIVDFGTWSVNMTDCAIYANTDKDNLIVLFQDKENPDRRIQITLSKGVQSPG